MDSPAPNIPGRQTPEPNGNDRGSESPLAGIQFDLRLIAGAPEIGFAAFERVKNRPDQEALAAAEGRSHSITLGSARALSSELFALRDQALGSGDGGIGDGHYKELRNFVIALAALELGYERERKACLGTKPPPGADSTEYLRRVDQLLELEGVYRRGCELRDRAAGLLSFQSIMEIRTESWLADPDQGPVPKPSEWRLLLRLYTLQGRDYEAKRLITELGKRISPDDRTNRVALLEEAVNLYDRPNQEKWWKKCDAPARESARAELKELRPEEPRELPDLFSNHGTPLDLAHAARFQWDNRSSQRWLQMAIGDEGGSAKDRLEAAKLSARLYLEARDFQGAGESFRAALALELANGSPDEMTVADLHYDLARCALESGDLEAAVRSSATAVELFRRLAAGDPGGFLDRALAASLLIRGTILRKAENLDGAEEVLTEALAKSSTLRDGKPLIDPVSPLLGLAQVNERRWDLYSDTPALERARANLLEVKRHFTEGGSDQGADMLGALEGLIQISTKLGRDDEVAGYAKEAEVIRCIREINR